MIFIILCKILNFNILNLLLKYYININNLIIIF